MDGRRITPNEPSQRGQHVGVALRPIRWLRLLAGGLCVAALLVLIFVLSSNSYPALVFRENMLRSTPYAPTAGHPQPKQWANDRVTVCWIGHSTVLINLYGTTILTDPVLGEHLAPPEIWESNVGIRRIRQLPLQFADLPRIDVVLLSHAHHDHWDLETLRQFGSETAVVIPEATSDLVPAGHFGQVIQLPWDQRVQVGAVTISAVHVAHWGERWSLRGGNPWRGYNGYLLEAGGRRIFFAGDSAFRDRRTGDAIEWARLLGNKPCDLCLLPIGAYTYWHNHMGPKEAWSLFRQVRGQYLVPIHWGTFILAPRDLEPVDEPLKRLLAVAGAHVDRIVAEEPGTIFVLPEPGRR